MGDSIQFSDIFIFFMLQIFPSFIHVRNLPHYSSNGAISDSIFLKELDAQSDIDLMSPYESPEGF